MRASCFSIIKNIFQPAFLVVFLLSGFGAYGIKAASAATYYTCDTGTACNAQSSGWVTGSDANACTTKGAPCKTIGGGIGKLASGDTLVVGDGTYVGTGNFINSRMYLIPDGTALQDTTIMAENPLSVRIQNGGTLNYYDNPVLLESGTNYVKIDGFIFDHSNSQDSSYTVEIDGDFNKVTRSIVKRSGETDQYGGWFYIGGNDNLLEDTAGVGSARYGYAIGGPTATSQRNIVRRAVGRVDYSVSTQPKAAFNIYGNDDGNHNVRDNFFQNAIAIDSKKGSNTGEATYGGFYLPKEPETSTLQGCISLNVEAEYSGYFIHELQAQSLSLIDSVAWGGSGNASIAGIRANGSGTGTLLLDHVTVGGYANGYYNYDSTPARILRNSAFISNTALTGGTDYGWTSVTNNAFYPTGQAIGTNPVSATSTTLQYIVRPEVGSVLDNAGTSGSDIGADVTKQYGVSGTRYGDTGYDQKTATSLWPWPYEDEIKAVFSESNPAPVGATPSTNTVARGFTTGTSIDGSSQTLTKYIWEYLGNQIPADVYGSSTTYYISPSGSDAAAGTTSGAPWKTFSKAFTTMVAGDELILLDGTYSEAAGTGYISYLGTNSAQIPSGTSSSNMTYVHAQNPGSVRVTGDLFVGRSTRKDSYIKIQGITFTGGGQLYNTSYITIKDCGFDGSFGIGTNDHDNGNTDNLIEDVWIWASGERVIVPNYRADRNVWRRVVVRGDGCGTVSCTGSGNPNVGFTVYESADVSVQNMIVIDRILSVGDEPYADFAVAQHTVGYPFGRSEWLGTMSVNSEDAGYYMEPDDALDPSIKISNAAAINDAIGFNIARIDHNNELENLTAVINGSGDGIRVVTTNSSGTLVNALVTGTGRYGINSAYAPSYASVSGTWTSSYNQTSCSTGCYTANPQSNGTLLYPTRIESGSQLKGVGSATGASTDIGANIVYRYGTDGTHFGESGYNTLSGTALWAWPNQDRIKDEMCTDAGVTRGFCASGNGLYGGAVTLTSYIWESLGNACPSDICPAGADTTAPTVTSVSSDAANGSYNAGDVIDIDVTFSEAVTSTGSVTVTLETGTTDRTCTFTVSSSTTGTCNYTVQAGDTSADLTINSVAGVVNDAASNPMTTPATPTTNLAANKALIIDTTAPSAPSGLALSSPASSPSTDTTPTITVSGVVSGDTVRLYSDTCTTEVASGTAAGTTISLTSSALTQATYAFHAQSTDPVGNASSCSSASVSYTLDTTAPTNQNTVFAASTTKTGGATVTIVSSADATNSVWFAPSGTSTFSAGSTMTTAGGTATSILAPATAGSYKLYVIDQAGNASSASTATLTVDTTTPTRSAGSPSGALVSGTTSTTISLTTDENATCKYATVSGTAYASMTNTFTTTGTTSHSTTVSGLSDGTSYTYFVRCQDTATNPNSTDYSISFSVSTTSDVTAPSVPTNLAGSAASTSAINLSWTASTDDTAVSTYEVYRNGTQITSTASTSYQDTGLAAGTSYLYSVLAKDAANNASSQTSQVSVTTSSATVSSSSGGGGGGGGSKKKKKKSISGKIITRPGERAAPWVTLTAPRVGTVLPKRFTVSAVSSDRSGIQAMIVTVNGTKKKRSNTGSVSYTLAKKSSMTVNVNAYDALGNRKTAEVRIAGGKVVGVRYW